MITARMRLTEMQGNRSTRPLFRPFASFRSREPEPPFRARDFLFPIFKWLRGPADAQNGQESPIAEQAVRGLRLAVQLAQKVGP